MERSQGRRPWSDRKLQVAAEFADSFSLSLSLFLSLSFSLSLSLGFSIHFHFSFSPALDPIISCPLSGSVCYAIGLPWSGPAGRLFCKSNRRTALRWSSLSPLILSPRRPLATPLHSSPSSPFSFVPSAESVARCGAAAILFLENDQQAAHFRFVLSTQRRLPATSLFLSLSVFVSLCLFLSRRSSYLFLSPRFFFVVCFFLPSVALPRRVWWRHGQQRS